jgi:hypothetical protein
MIQYKHQQRQTTKHGDNMKVYVGKFYYYYDGDTSVVVATTVERIEQELIKLAQQYVECAVDGEDLEEIVGNPTTFDEWRQVGWNNEWYGLEWVLCDILSDEHILKHVMETV